MSTILLGLIASVAGASTWLVIRRVLAIYRARRARQLRAEAGRLRSEVLKEIERLEARHRRLQGHLAVADQGGGQARQRQDLRASFGVRARAELVDLRARTEQAYAAVATGPDLGLSERCSSLSAIDHQVATWDKALTEREAALRPPLPVARLGRHAPAVSSPTTRLPRRLAQEPRPLLGYASRA